MYNKIMNLTRCVICTGIITAKHGIIPAIGKHVIAQGALASGDEGIGINKSTDFGIVVTGLEVVETGFSVLMLTSMPVYT